MYYIIKQRLVAKRLAQFYGVDLNERYAPEAKSSTIRDILAIEATVNLEIHQMDVKTTFLNGELKENINIEQSEEFVQKVKGTLFVN